MPGEAGVKSIKMHKPKPFKLISHSLWSHKPGFSPILHFEPHSWTFLPHIPLRSPWPFLLAFGRAAVGLGVTAAARSRYRSMIYSPACLCLHSPPTSHTLHSARCPQGLARTHKRKWTNTTQHLSPLLLSQQQSIDHVTAALSSGCLHFISSAGEQASATYAICNQAHT